MGKRTQEDRRILGWCLLAGVFTGTAAAIGAAVLFDQEAGYEVCAPGSSRLCRHLELVGFDLRSGSNAAAILGPMVGFVAFVFFLVFALYSTQQRPQ